MSILNLRLTIQPYANSANRPSTNSWDLDPRADKSGKRERGNSMWLTLVVTNVLSAPAITKSVIWQRQFLLLFLVKPNRLLRRIFTAYANSHATSCIERAREVLLWTMIGQVTIAIALLGFKDLGCLVSPTFLFRNRFYLQLSPHCKQMNIKSMWEVKKISYFLKTSKIIRLFVRIFQTIV